MRYKLYPPGARKGNRTYVVRAWVNGRQVEKVLEATKRPNAESEADEVGREDARSINHPPGHVIYRKVGKKAAGAQLDGKMHREFPT